MNVITTLKRPDQLTAGDHLYHPAGKRWLEVKAAQWSEASQQYVVKLGPLGASVHTYPRGARVNAQRYYH